MRATVHYIPILTTIVALAFARVVLQRYSSRGGYHLLWWGIGLMTYAAGTLTESLTTLLGWHEPIFRAWYIAGALLGGAPLAQGTVYLMLRKTVADRLSVALITAVTAGALLVLASPIDYAAVQPYRLSGRVFEWQWVRAVSPVINLYAVVFLVGGAIVSALRYARRADTHHRAAANALIAVGAILPGIGGTFTRFGHTEVLYVTELLGLLLIYGGYRASVGSSVVQRLPTPAAEAT